MALIDLPALMVFVGVGVAFGIRIGHQYGVLGGLAGFFVGSIGSWALVFFLFRGIDFVHAILFDGRPYLPVCRSGKCKLAKYKIREEQRAYLWVCECGGRYRKLGRHFYEVLPDGSSRPYMVWRRRKKRDRVRRRKPVESSE